MGSCVGRTASGVGPGSVGRGILKSLGVGRGVGRGVMRRANGVRGWAWVGRAGHLGVMRRAQRRAGGVGRGIGVLALGAASGGWARRRAGRRRRGVMRRGERRAGVS